MITSSNFWVIIHRARMHLRRCIELKWFKKAEVH
jgi:DNA-directed RNA polymerase specialized sigma24 family protein